jgi:hypothetical protein
MDAIIESTSQFMDARRAFAVYHLPFFVINGIDAIVDQDAASRKGGRFHGNAIQRFDGKDDDATKLHSGGELIAQPIAWLQSISKKVAFRLTRVLKKWLDS